jgi:uncharacterized protein YihD (DUF1040 family)
MELKYVGDLPRVSQHGVSFDHTKTDKYIYLHAILELLEALSFGATQTTQHLYKTQYKELKPKELLEGLKRFIPNLEAVYEQRTAKAQKLIEELKARVESNEMLNEDEKKAWLNNIDIMKDYYLQYVTNESVYEAALDALADEIAVAKVLELKIPIFRNYGIIVDDLKSILEQRKSPIDTSFVVDATDEGIIGTVKFYHN